MGHGSHLIRWDKMLNSHAQGALDLQRLLDKYRALLAKWVWRYYHEGEALWKQVIDAKHGKSSLGSWPNSSFPNYVKGPWGDILKFITHIKDKVKINEKHHILEQQMD